MTQTYDRFFVWNTCSIECCTYSYVQSDGKSIIHSTFHVCNFYTSDMISIIPLQKMWFTVKWLHMRKSVSRSIVHCIFQLILQHDFLPSTYALCDHMYNMGLIWVSQVIWNKTGFIQKSAACCCVKYMSEVEEIKMLRNNTKPFIQRILLNEQTPCVYIYGQN